MIHELVIKQDIHHNRDTVHHSKIDFHDDFPTAEILPNQTKRVDFILDPPELDSVFIR